jgi:hydrophobe/amphiphile efflux-1 (HAE1) family protein
VSLSDPFIRRPIATSLVAAAMVIAGVLGFVTLPVAPLPRVDFPTISISASLPGASPETMATAVATPLERRCGRIAGLTEMTSTSGAGQANVTLQFDLDRDIDSAARDVQAAINAAAGDLPPGLPTLPSFRKANPSDSPILILALSSKTLPMAQVYDYASTILAQRISQVEGVGQVTIGGGQNPAVRVQFDPVALAGRGLSTAMVRSALVGQSVDGPKGRLTDDGKTARIAANDQLLGAAAWRRAIIANGPGGAVRIEDVAKVVDSVENERVAGWTDLERSVSLQIRRQPDANILDVIRAVKQELPELGRLIPPSIDVRISVDRSQTIRASVHEVEIALVVAVILVVLVVFAFLRSVRATLVPTVAVPLSLVATFAVMKLIGYSIDNLSLMALTISTGFVVDDAIVVTENIARRLDEGASPLRAAMEGARQISFTILSITASLLAVFIPILFMSGIVGRLFREFAVTLATAIAVSGLVSLTITPSMCAVLLRAGGGHGGGRVGAWLEARYLTIERAYARALRVVLGHRGLVGLVTLATVALSVTLYVYVPKGLFPQQDTGMIMCQIEAAQDVSFAEMKRRTQALLQIVVKDPDVDHAIGSLGSGFGSGAVNNGNIFIGLKQKPARKASADEVIGRLRKATARVEGITLYPQAVQDVRIGGRASRTQFQYSLQDADLDELNRWAPRVMARLKTLPMLRDVATDQQTGGVQLAVIVDRDTASRLGITAAAVDDVLNDAFGQRQVGLSYTEQNSYRTVIELDPAIASRGPAALDSLFVTSSSGNPVPLSAIARWTTQPTTLSVGHQSQFAAVTLSFNTAPGTALSDAVEAVNAATSDMGLPASIRAGFQGTAQAFKQTLSSQPLLITAAILAVYIVLGMLYESYVHPLTILSTIPSAGVGALLALLLTGTELSIIGIIAIILLIGIVKKNAILIVDFAIERRREGKGAEEAIYEACVQRFRPILMTTLAALLGAVPLVIGGGTGSEMRRPLGVAIVGGLIMSQLLTLFTTPVTYLALDRLSARRRRTEEVARELERVDQSA